MLINKRNIKILCLENGQIPIYDNYIKIQLVHCSNNTYCTCFLDIIFRFLDNSTITLIKNEYETNIIYIIYINKYKSLYTVSFKQTIKYNKQTQMYLFGKIYMHKNFNVQKLSKIIQCDKDFITTLIDWGL